MSCDIPLLKNKCPTCPFRAGSPYEYLAADIAQSALKEGRICHSTGRGNAINEETGRKEHLCRGARDLQLAFMHGLGVISAPTDEAWNAQRVAIGMPPTPIVESIGEAE